MDIFAHGLWAGAAAKAANRLPQIQKEGNSIRVWWATWWGVFPDLFAFTIPFVWLVWQLATGAIGFGDWPRPDAVEPVSSDRFPVFQLAAHLYNISHSAVIFILVFGVVWAIWRRPRWELGGWFLHILLDIPTHTYRFYPTPFLWPVSGSTFNGFSWATPWFLALNYAAIILVYILLRKRATRAHASTEYIL